MDSEQVKLIEALEHIIYEFWMLKGTFIILKEKSKGKNELKSYTSIPSAQLRIVDIISPVDFHINDELIQHNALMESYTTHARCLLSFFYPEKRKKYQNDIQINHLLRNEQTWENIRPSFDQNEITDLYNRISREISHLTYYRKNINREKIWDVELIFSKLEQVYSVFIVNVSDEIKKNLSITNITIEDQK